YVAMPEIWGVELTGTLPDWVSAKDVVLEMLRRHDVKGGVNRIIEYHGPGLADLTAIDRHGVANMGADRGATTTVFPADDVTRAYMEAVGRAEEFTPLAADEGATYDVTEHIDLSQLEPLIAKPSSPGNVVPVAQVSDEEVTQVVVGSSANPGLRDFAVVAEILDGQQAHQGGSGDIHPTCRAGAAGAHCVGWVASTANRRIRGSRWISTRPRGRCWPTSSPAGGWPRSSARGRASTNPAAWAASGWGRPRPVAAIPYARCHATSPDGPAPRRT